MEERDHILTLLRSDDPRQRKTALQTLPSEYSEEVILVLIDLLRDDHLPLRQASMEALIKKGKSVIDPLIEALRIDDYDIIFNVIRILGSIGDPRSTEHLIEIAEDAPESLQYEVIEALVKINDDRATLTLVHALGHKEPAIRDLAEQGLVNLGTVILPELYSALHSRQWLVRSYAARILGRIGDADALHPLIDALAHADLTFRIEVIRALGILRDPKAIPPLLKALGQGDPETIKPLIETLAVLQDPRTVGYMIRAIKAEEWNQHQYIVDSIVSMGPKVIEEAGKEITNSSSRIRIAAAKILGKFEEKNAAPFLIALSRDTDQEVRRIAASSLSLHPGEDCVGALIELLGDRYSAISSQAAKSLIEMAPYSRAPLTKSLRHNNPTIRRRAATLLCRKDMHSKAEQPFRLGPEFTPYLMDCLQEERQYLKYITHLLRHIKGDGLAQRIGLLYQGHSEMTPLLEELQQLRRWQHISLIAKDLPILVAQQEKRQSRSATQALKETAKEQRKYVKDGYCLDHHARFSKYDVSGIDYLGCRFCQSTIFGIEAPSVCIVLDKRQEGENTVLPDRVLVNYFRVNHQVDFDCVHIGACAKEEIRSFCIAIGNDTDPFRRNGYATATCTIDPTAQIDEEIYNLLTNQFTQVKQRD